MNNEITWIHSNPSVQRRYSDHLEIPDMPNLWCIEPLHHFRMVGVDLPESNDNAETNPRSYQGLETTISGRNRGSTVTKNDKREDGNVSVIKKMRIMV